MDLEKFHGDDKKKIFFHRRLLRKHGNELNALDTLNKKYKLTLYLRRSTMDEKKMDNYRHSDPFTEAMNRMEDVLFALFFGAMLWVMIAGSKEVQEYEECEGKNRMRPGPDSGIQLPSGHSEVCVCMEDQQTKINEISDKVDEILGCIKCILECNAKIFWIHMGEMQCITQCSKNIN